MYGCRGTEDPAGAFYLRSFPCNIPVVSYAGQYQLKTRGAQSGPVQTVPEPRRPARAPHLEVISPRNRWYERVGFYKLDQVEPIVFDVGNYKSHRRGHFYLDNPKPKARDALSSTVSQENVHPMHQQKHYPKT